MTCNYFPSYNSNDIFSLRTGSRNRAIFPHHTNRFAFQILQFHHARRLASLAQFISPSLREPVYSYNSFIFLYTNTLHKLRYCVLIRVPQLTFRQDKYLVTMIVWKERMK